MAGAQEIFPSERPVVPGIQDKSSLLITTSDDLEHDGRKPTETLSSSDALETAAAAFWMPMHLPTRAVRVEF